MSLESIKISKLMIKITIIVFFLHLIATKLYLYNQFFWFDMLMHFLGGLLVSICIFYIFSKFRNHISINKNLLIFFVFVIGLLWEIYEYIISGFTGVMLATPLDSISDLFFDIAGGLYSFHLINENDKISLWNKKN